MANPYFNATYYLANNPDVFAAGINTAEGAWAHYQQFGAREALNGAASRSPAPWFDISYYLTNNPDLATAGLSASQLFDHFTTYGLTEGRQPSANANVNATTLKAYAAANADLRTAFGIESGVEPTKAQLDALAQHFYQYGYNEQREGKPSTSDVNPGKTFTLTTGVDTFVGTASNDTFVATNATFQAADTIDGGAGKDTLKITVDGAKAGGSGATLLPAADVKNVEVVSVRNVQSGAAADAALTVTGTNFVGATEFVNDRSTADVNFNNIGKADVTVQGNGVAVHTATNIAVGGSVVTDAFVLNIKDGVLGGAIDVNDANARWTNATINSTGAANTVGAVNLSGAGAGGTHYIKDLTINADSNLSAAGGITGFDTTAGVTNSITVKGGASSVNIGQVAGVVDVLDASGLVGGVTATLNAQTNVKVTGGAGNDVITSDGILLAAGSFVDAGAGEADRLVLTTAIASDTAGKASAALYKGFEELRLNNGITQDVSIFAGSTMGKVILAAGGTVQNASAAQAANIQAMGSGTYDIGVKGATTVGQIDTVHITADDGVAGMAAGPIALGTPTLAGVENLQLTANDNVTVASLASATSLTSISLGGAASIGLTTDAVNFSANTKIDGSAATGALTINASAAQAAATATGLAITGGAGNDFIQGTVRSDIIVGGAGNDLIGGTAITGTVGAVTGVAASTAADVLTGGAGNDTFAIGVVDAFANVTSITDLDLGTNTATGRVDTLIIDQAFAGAATIVTLSAAQQATVTATANLGAAAAAVLGVAGTAGNVVQFSYGTDSYLLVNGDGNATFNFADDAIVKITGVVGTLDASDITLI